MKFWRITLIIWGLFIGLGAVGGGIAMLMDTSGKMMGLDPVLPYMPFATFLIPAIALIILNGVTQLILAFMGIINHSLTAFAGMICGGILMIWIIVQLCFIDFNILSAAYFVFGLLEFGCGIGLWLTIKKQSRVLSSGLLR